MITTLPSIPSQRFGLLLMTIAEFQLLLKVAMAREGEGPNTSSSRTEPGEKLARESTMKADRVD
jgi:hypothetical protein